MFSIAIFIGIYSYLIFLLGLFGLLYKQTIIFVTVLYFVCIYFLIQRSSVKKDIKSVHISLPKRKLSIIFLSLLAIQALINFAGAISPELAFDALWYHLTLPKIYLANHSLVHIPGNLMYYSDMPKLTEMLYTVSFALHSETLAKLIHFVFGILCCVALYKFSRRFFSEIFSLMVVVIFYLNLVVDWESTTAYIDLSRTFFEILALWAFVLWQKNKEKKWLIESAVMTGLAISTKLLSLGSLGIFIGLIFYEYMIQKKRNVLKVFMNISLYLFFALLIPLPWFVFSYIHTGNPMYPFFTNLYPIQVNSHLLNPVYLIKDFWNLFIRADDPISPLYIIYLPIAFYFYKKFSQESRLIFLYAALALGVWYITPRTGGGRFILPYLPVLSLCLVFVIERIWKIKSYKYLCIILIFFVSSISIVYRGVSTIKCIPYLIGKETKSQFLTKYLNFNFGDFYDTDGYFNKKITSQDVVLLYGFHNLYYVKFPFVDRSWVKKGQKFNYIAVQDQEIPERFSYWQQVYYNPTTHVKLYKLGDNTWMY